MLLASCTLLYGMIMPLLSAISPRRRDLHGPTARPATTSRAAVTLRQGNTNSAVAVRHFMLHGKAAFSGPAVFRLIRYSPFTGQPDPSSPTPDPQGRVEGGGP